MVQENRARQTCASWSRNKPGELGVAVQVEEIKPQAAVAVLGSKKDTTKLLGLQIHTTKLLGLQIHTTKLLGLQIPAAAPVLILRQWRRCTRLRLCSSKYGGVPFR